MRPVHTRREPGGAQVVPLATPGAHSARPFDLAAITILLIAPGAGAESEARAAPALPIGTALGGGEFVWWLLLGLSIVAIALLCEGVLAARRGRTLPPSSFAGWTPAFGLAALLALTATSWWQIRAVPGTARNELPLARTPPAANHLRASVSADGGLTVDGENATVEPQALANRLSGSSPARPLDLSIDARATGEKVDKLLGRLRDAGVTRLSLLVDPTATRTGVPTPSATAHVRALADPELDLEVPRIDISSRGDGVLFRIGRREAGSVGELQRLIQPLARLGGSISVRISHDGPFARSAEAIAACRDAGFTMVLLVPGEPGP